MAVNFKVHLLKRKTLLNLIILFSFLIFYGKAAKLTVPRILLPYNTGVPTNYTLEVKEGGCYKWYCTSSLKKHDLLLITKFGLVFLYSRLI